ncbi:MAG: hypothetical protein K6A43_12495 [Treponema sp.]|nr:hypothetical protein [Treponema sp.]
MSEYVPVSNLLVKMLENLDKVYKNKAQDGKIIWNEIAFCKDDLVVFGTDYDFCGTDLILSLLKNLSIENKIPAGYIAVNGIDEQSFGQKLLALQAQIGLKKIKTGNAKIEDIKKIQSSSEEIFNSPIFINCKPNASFEEIKLSVQKMTEEQHVQMVIVDGLEFIKDILDEKNPSYWLRLEELMSDFKELAKELDITVVLFTKVRNCYIENKPDLDDFKEDATIPYFADVVATVYKRYHYEDTDFSSDIEKDGNVGISIIKNNRGNTGDFSLILRASWF